MEFFCWTLLLVELKTLVLSFLIKNISPSRFLIEIREYASVCREFYHILRSKQLYLSMLPSFIAPVFTFKRLSHRVISTRSWRNHLIVASEDAMLMANDGSIIIRSKYILCAGDYLAVITLDKHITIYFKEIKHDCIVYEGELDTVTVSMVLTKIGLVIRHSGRIAYLKDRKLFEINHDQYFMCGYNGMYSYISFMSWEQILEQNFTSPMIIEGYCKYVVCTENSKDLIMRSLSRPFRHQISLLSPMTVEYTVLPVDRIVNLFMTKEFILCDNRIMDYVGNVLYRLDDAHQYVAMTMRGDGCGYYLYYEDTEEIYLEIIRRDEE